ncbi:MAG: hypothetical protein VKK03_01450 [Synechococcus sp.]|nr:hypothetical protein [Synechococcus sp.]
MGVLLSLSACTDGGSSGLKVFPLQRSQPHDGLAVVSQPDGFGLHIYLETDTSKPDRCQPRWLPDPARLFNGNGTTPFSSGVATRSEFFAAVVRPEVRRALQQELKALCAARAPKARWHWIDPPTQASAVESLRLPAWEEKHLLTDPKQEQVRQDALVPKPSQTTDSASRQ